MPEELKEEVKEPQDKKSVFGKIKDKILPDQDEQAAIISTFVRLGVLVWSGGILTLNYVAIPGVPQQKIDPTFIASVFTGVLASFGIQTASKKGDGTMKMDAAKAAAAANGNGNGGTVQTIRIEQMPLKIIAADIPPTLDPKKDQKPPTV
jgi:hypothetical protein|tara:strand:+ start:966 stop:1415 length:450 start_codon:yes stop_codon:yes gene_type:complete